jgi:hypothetical protein
MMSKAPGTQGPYFTDRRAVDEPGLSELGLRSIVTDPSQALAAADPEK